MKPNDPKSHAVSKPAIRPSTVIVLSLLIAVQVAMLVVLNIFDYSYIFPSRSGLDLGHWYLFVFIYLLSLLGGVGFAILRRCWLVGLAQVMMPFLIVAWLTWPRHFNPAKYQTLVGKTRAEVDETLGWDASNGRGRDEEGSFISYNGMRIRYVIVNGTKDDPAKDDRVKAVEPN